MKPRSSFKFSGGCDIVSKCRMYGATCWVSQIVATVISAREASSRQELAHDPAGRAHHRQFLTGDEFAIDRSWRQRLPGEDFQVAADLAVLEQRRHLLADEEAHRFLARDALDDVPVEQGRVG